MQINMTADGDSAVFVTAPGAADGLVEVFVQAGGDFGDGTLSLLVDLGSGGVTEYQWTAGGSRIFELPPAASCKFNLDGSTDADIDIELRGPVQPSA